MPLVSVVMPSHNHERFIAQSIASVLGQEFDDLELIIVDDASKDASREIIERYAAEDSRIRVIFHDANCGISKTSNDGIDAAKGKFIARNDSDDVWMKNKLTKQLEVLESNENRVIWSEGVIIDQDGRPTGKRMSDILGVARKGSGYIFHELLGNNYIFTSSLLYKRQNAEGIRFDPSLLYTCDYKFELELARKYEYYYIDEPLVQYRVHGENTLEGSGADQIKRQRIAHRERIQMCHEALQQYYGELPRTTKATVYHALAREYRALGEQKEGLRAELQAVRHAPLVICPFFVKRMLGRVGIWIPK